MIKVCHMITVGIVASILSGCVTKNYENNADTPRVENTASNNEIAMTRISLGMGYLNMGNTTQAKLNLEKAKRYAPNLTQVYTAFAQYYDVVDEPEQAIAAFEYALSLDEDDADTLNNYGVFLCKQEKYDESEIVLLKAIAVPSYLLVSQSYENLATCQLENKNFDKAELYLAKSISHSPTRSSSLLQMLRLQYAMGNYDESIQYLKRYEKTTRRFVPNALALAYKSYEKTNNMGTAKNYAALLVKMFPNSYEAQQYILNGLQHIEADNLAETFLSLNNKKSSQPKKRVMVLSPNKKTGISVNTEKKEISELATPVSKDEVTVSESDIPSEVSVKETVVTEKIEDIQLEDKASPTQLEANLSAVESQKEQPKVTENTETLQLEDDISSLELIDDLSKAEVQEEELETVTEQASLNEQNNKMLTLPIHMIERGDNLYSIARRYNLKIFQIERWNGFKRSKILKVGDVIYLADPKKAVKH